MEENKSDSAIKNDVLHSEDHSKLTPEEIAKAVAHHNRHHKENAPKKAEPMKQQAGEKRK
jgi:hypothetical protein